MPARTTAAKHNPQQQTFPWHQAKQRKPNGWWAAWHRRLSITWSAIARDLNSRSGIVSMGEVRISDKLLNDPRMLRLAQYPLARLLFWEGYMWADKEASDGFIDDVVVKELCRGFEREMQVAIDWLIRVGFWVRRDSGFYIVGYMESGKLSRVKRLAKEQSIKEERSKAGKKGSDARWGRDGKPMANPMANDGKSNSEMANEWQPKYSDADGAALSDEAAEF